jgi:hypothetical protein
LLLACVGLAVLLCGLWFSVRRPSAGGRASDGADVPAPESSAELQRPERVAAELAPARERVPEDLDELGERSDDPAGAAPLPATEPAAVAGRLVLDGVAPDGGRLWLRAADGSWEGAGALDPEGRFHLGGVPARELVLAFELLDLEPLEPRLIFLPELVLHPQPGATEELTLDWRTTHVNVRVLSDAPEGSRARVSVTGPRTDASFETDDDGKARLRLGGEGRFRFHAVQRSGREGESELELAADGELESVVIQVRPPGAR